jgi:hypothetical protein
MAIASSEKLDALLATGLEQPLRNFKSIPVTSAAILGLLKHFFFSLRGNKNLR